MPRSLRASPVGIRAAHIRLDARNFSKRAFAQELQFAYSTVSKFFNGHPVDRQYFTEICEALGLEWEDVALMPDSVEVEHLFRKPAPTPDPDPPRDRAINTVRTHSDRARRALDPYLLQPIPRQALRDRALQEIDRARADRPRILSILGEAGHGKSTLLGFLYDALRDRVDGGQLGWVALARCDDLIETADTFAIELGERLVGDRQSIVEVATRLNAAAGGHGVLLLDTLDLVLTADWVPVLRRLWPQLLDTGTTVVLTCRDRDYRDFFEPYHESFAGFRNAVVEQLVGPFDGAEIREAVDRFLAARPAYASVDRRRAFADRLLDLSVDRESLLEIAANPLLLALCCDLFAESGRVPEDLTVSQLYDTYWNLRIARSRQADRRLGRQKGELCLRLAGRLWQQSRDRLRDFIYLADLDADLGLDADREAAYQTLCSDGVLKDIGGDRVAFFHQTFLEYAIARWLTATAAGETARPLLLREVVRAPDAIAYFWWAIARQVLVLLSAAECRDWLAVWPLAVPVSFRTVALAVVSRPLAEAEPALALLLSAARDRDGAFHQALLVAVNSLPRRANGLAWEMLVGLLPSVGPALANRAIECCALWTARADRDRAERLLGVLDAIAIDRDAELALALMGQFLSDYAVRLRQESAEGVDRSVLAALRDRYRSFGTFARARIVALHHSPGVGRPEWDALVAVVLALPPEPTFSEREPMRALLADYLPIAIAAGDTAFGSSWWDALAAPIDAGWAALVAEVVGDRAAAAVAFIDGLLDRLWDGALPGSAYRLALLCLQAATRSRPVAIERLLLRSLDELEPSRLSGFYDFARSLASQPLPVRSRTFEWLLAGVDRAAVVALPALDELVGDAPGDLRDRFGELLRDRLPLLDEKDLANVLKRLRSVPIAVLPWLEGQRSKEARRLLLRDADARDDRDRLVAACGDPSKDAAQLAARLLLEGAARDRWPDWERLGAIASGSPIVGVRQRSVELVGLALRQGAIALDVAVAVLLPFSDDRAEEVCQGILKGLESIFWRGQAEGVAVPESAVLLALEMLDRAIEEVRLRQPLARLGFHVLAQMALCDRAAWWVPVADRARRLFRVTNLSRIDNKIVTGLLVRSAKVDPTFLETIAREDCLDAIAPMPLANQTALTMAIVSELGARSRLLDELLASELVGAPVKERIYRSRGL